MIMSSKYITNQFELEQTYPHGMSLGTLIGLGEMNEYTQQDFHSIPLNDFSAMIAGTKHAQGLELRVIVVRNKATNGMGQRVVVEQFLVHVPKDTPIAITCNPEPKVEQEAPGPVDEKLKEFLSQVDDPKVKAAKAVFDDAKKAYEEALKNYYSNDIK